MPVLLLTDLEASMGDSGMSNNMDKLSRQLYYHNNYSMGTTTNVTTLMCPFPELTCMASPYRTHLSGSG